MHPWRNLILSRVPPAEQKVIAPHLRREQFARNDVVFPAGQRIDRVLFPEDCIVSLVIELPDGRSVEEAAVGYEGVAGVGGTLSGEHSYTLQRIQAEGAGYVIEHRRFERMQEECPDFAAAIQDHRDAFTAMLLQSIACNASHHAEERLARWLLELLDRSQSRNMSFTHDVLALMVGVSRPTVSLLLRAFEADALVKTNRGRVVVLDKPGLETVACSCYALIRDVYDRVGLLPSGPVAAE